MQGYKICEDLTTHPSRKRVPAWGIPEKSTYIDFGNREVAQFRPPREVLAFPFENRRNGTFQRSGRAATRGHKYSRKYEVVALVFENLPDVSLLY